MVAEHGYFCGPALSSRCARDMQGMSEEEEQPEVYHDSNSSWLEIQEVKERLRKLDAFDQEIHGLPLMHSPQNMEMRLKLSAAMDKMEHNNQAMEVKIKELEEKEEKNNQYTENQMRAPHHFADKNKDGELVNSKNSDQHRWVAE